jgi:uncharacterized membrane protein
VEVYKVQDPLEALVAAVVLVSVAVQVAGVVVLLVHGGQEVHAALDLDD